MFSRRQTRQSAEVLLSCLCLLAVGAVQAEGPARLVGLQAEPKTGEIILNVENGWFDPILQLDGNEKEGYRVIVQGENIDASPPFAQNLPALSRTVHENLPEIQTVKLQSTGRNTIGEPGIRLVLESSQRLQPQIRENTGGRITIALIRAPQAPVASLNALVTLNQPANVTLLADSQSLYAAMSVGNPADVTEAARQGWSMLQTGRAEDAILHLQTHLAANPADKWARYVLATAYGAEHQQDKQLEALTRLTNEPNNGFLPAYRDLITLHTGNRNYAVAENLLYTALAVWPTDPGLLYHEGVLHEVQGRPEEAKAAYIKVLRYSPENPLPHYRLALVELKLNHPQAARLELNQALRLSPDDNRLQKMLGYLAEADKKPEQAAKYYTQALNPDVMINYGRMLAAQNDSVGAVALYKAVEAIAPGNPDILFNLGMLYAEIQQAEQAERLLKKFISLRENTRDSRLAQARNKLKSVTAPEKKS